MFNLIATIIAISFLGVIIYGVIAYILNNGVSSKW